MATKRAEPKEQVPSEPPSVDRRLELSWPQLIGFPVLALIPVLAVAGVFGEHWTSTRGEGSHLRAQVEYPDRLRAKLSKPLMVSVENRSTATLDTVDVAFDSAYVERFTAVNFIPSARGAYVVSLIDVRPGETQRVHLELEGDRVGRHQGRVVIRGRGDSAVVRISTIVFP